MIINKITTGFVIQSFDTELGKYVSQSFTAGNEVDYELSDGTMASFEEMAANNFGPDLLDGEPYLPFDMKQPE